MKRRENFIVLLDVDNVLEDLTTAWINAVNIKFGTNVNPDDITDWEMKKFFPNLSRTQIYSPLHTKEFWKSLEPMTGAKKYVELLIEKECEVCLVTSSHPDTVAYKYNFIKKHFPMIAYNDIFFCSRKQLVIGDVLVDDKPKNLIGGSYHKLLMDCPHNRSFDETKYNIKRVKNWREVFNAIIGIKKEKQSN